MTVERFVWQKDDIQVEGLPLLVSVAVTSEGLTVFKASVTADQETEQIRTSAKTQPAQLPHPFKSAQWTHPNGHPRCRVCGCEERVDGTCPGLKAEPVRFGPGAVKVATSEGIVVAKVKE